MVADLSGRTRHMLNELRRQLAGLRAKRSQEGPDTSTPLPAARKGARAELPGPARHPGAASFLECQQARARARGDGGRWQHILFAPGVIAGVVYNPPLGFTLSLEARRGVLSDGLAQQAVRQFFPDMRADALCTERTPVFFRCTVIDRAASIVSSDDEVRDALAAVFNTRGSGEALA